MGIVASLAAAPVAHDIIEDERSRHHQAVLDAEERLRKIREAELYKLGDVEIDLIKRYFLRCKRISALSFKKLLRFTEIFKVDIE